MNTRPRARITVEIISDTNGGFVAVLYPYLNRNEIHRTKRHASEPGAVHAAQVWAADCFPGAKLQFALMPA